VGAGNTPRTQKQTVWNGSRNSTKLSHGAARPLLLLSGNNKPPYQKKEKNLQTNSLHSAMHAWTMQWICAYFQW